MKRAPKTTAKKKVQFRHIEVEEPIMERLDYDQSATMHRGFGGILSVRMKLIPKKLAGWLLEKYNPWDNSLNLTNGKLLIDEEDVYGTLGLPMGEHEIIEGHSSDADIEFLELWRRRWYVKRAGPLIGSMDEVILDRGGHRQEFITDFIMYAISTCIVGNANGACHFRVVEVQFRRRKVERSFPTAINWDTDKVRNRDKEEQETREYRKGRLIARIDY
ncbi:hypothetical protein Cgig2_001052 [Carnegiea gigantea]|uniref:Uncharacterized protein n=1 Tax=Carnegiea gigantea TaxID=171969 RepID=A0A9Q1JQL0_9CARY|nr:hypothetical protein Cgig2_001052 [Carnegiea gigantea]